MTDCKFKKNIPKSITASQISDFNCKNVQETQNFNEIFNLGVE